MIYLVIRPNIATLVELGWEAVAGVSCSTGVPRKCRSSELGPSEV